MGKIKTAEEVKEALNAAAEHLAKVPYASKNLLFVADSIKKYLKSHKSEEPTTLGQEKKKTITLDRAFGLALGRGEYKRGNGKGKYTKDDEEKHIQMIKKAIINGFKVSKNGDVVRDKPMKTIAGLAGPKGYDEKDFKILFDRYKSQAIERIAAEIHIDFSDL
ncbi:MAG TPA: hypothetical protein PLJ94_06570 [Methylotenera sp.]|nr:hypothetical protein [Methylotenera sp.]HPH08328.1 hypothetical protein [Methylotenera sp.]HPN02338.1 hypothetical protein [Methylotenera sp.]